MFRKLSRPPIVLMVAIALFALITGIAANQLAASELITPDELITLIETDSPPAILDVRTPAEYARGHVPGAVNIHFQEISNRLDEVAALDQQKIVVYCERGIRASIAETTLEAAGYEVLQLEGDMVGWRSSGLPTE
ncbi:MAG: rhodanese-like domain-containing protein [Cyanobacteria bacterium P01_G01_bin.38]